MAKSLNMPSQIGELHKRVAAQTLQKGRSRNNRLSKTSARPSMGCATPNLLNRDRHSRQSLTSLCWLIGSDGLGTRVIRRQACHGSAIARLSPSGRKRVAAFLGTAHTRRARLGGVYHSMEVMHIIATGAGYPRRCHYSFNADGQIVLMLQTDCVAKHTALV